MDGFDTTEIAMCIETTRSDGYSATEVAGVPNRTHGLAGAKIVIVDDDASLCRAVARLLRAMGCEIACYGCARDALAASGVVGSDCLLLDLSMPEMSGLELQAEFRARGVEVPTLFLSGHGDIPTTVTAMRNGALDFLEKPMEADKLRAAIERAVALNAERKARAESGRAIRDRFDRLTDRQREVFEGVVAGNPNKVIAHRMDITIRTVKAHRKEVMEKLDAHSVAELAFIARDLGL